MQLTHIRLLVTDFDACFRFYRDVMRLQVVWGEEGGGYADFKVGEGVFLALFGRREMAESVGTTVPPADAEGQDRAMLIFHVDDLDTTVAQLKGRNVQFVTDVEDRPGWGIRTAHLRDPDGTLIELNSPLAKSKWTEGLREAAKNSGGAQAE